MHEANAIDIPDSYLQYMLQVIRPCLHEAALY